MDRINLISESRRLARRQRVRFRAWAITVTSYSAVLAAMCMMYRGLDPHADASVLASELADMDTDLAQIVQEQSGLKPQLMEQQLVLSAARSITDQPDWSLLLTYLAENILGEDVILSGCSLRPESDNVDANQLRDTAMKVVLEGHAKSTAAVSQFVLRLEESGVFDRVSLEKTKREPFLDGQAIAFETHCFIGGGSAGRTP